MKNNKSLGQHWLKNRTILNKIAELGAIDEKAVCLEIGPGLGTLTSSLLKRFSKVVAVEYDARLAENLPRSFPNTNLEVVHSDILQVDIGKLAGNNYVVVGNIPYYITSPIIRKLLETTSKPKKIVLLVQKEVAQRVAAEPGKHSWLSVMTQNQAAAELGPVVPAREFTPPPKVDSQVLVLTPHSEKVLSPAALALAKRGFSSPRKKLAHNLAISEISKEQWQQILQDNQINPDVRAEDLDLLDWEELVTSQKS